MAKIEILENGNIRVRVPLQLTVIGNRKRAINRENDVNDEASDMVAPLTLHLARAFRWRKFIDEGKFNNSQALSKALKLDRGYVDRTLRLTFLSPKIIHAIITNAAPEKFNLENMRRPFSPIWSEQEQAFDI